MPSPEDAALLGGFGEGIEARRVDAERKWGFGRLERLAAMQNPELLGRFRRQQVTWGQAYEAAWNAPFVSRDLLQTVIDKAGSMQRAWAALDGWAEEAGHRAVAPWVWEAVLQDGSVVALVEDDAGASKVIAEGRHLSVYTTKEIANLIDAIPDALKLAKTVWVGAKFVPSQTLPRSGSDWVEHGDPIPFGSDGDALTREEALALAPLGSAGASPSRRAAIAASGGQPAPRLPPAKAPARPAPSLAPKPPPVVGEGETLLSWEEDFG